MATPTPLKLAVRVAVFLLVMGLAFGAAIFGVPTGYYWWMQFQCWRAGPDSDACWWFDLLKYPDKPREGPGRSKIPHRGGRRLLDVVYRATVEVMSADEKAQPQAFRRYTEAIGRAHAMVQAEAQAADTGRIPGVVASYIEMGGHSQSALADMRRMVRAIDESREGLTPGELAVVRQEDEKLPPDARRPSPRRRRRARGDQRPEWRRVRRSHRIRVAPGESTPVKGDQVR